MAIWPQPNWCAPTLGERQSSSPPRRARNSWRRSKKASRRGRKKKRLLISGNNSAKLDSFPLQSHFLLLEGWWEVQQSLVQGEVLFDSICNGGFLQSSISVTSFLVEWKRPFFLEGKFCDLNSCNMLKSFDFFRKIQTDQELTSTTGGIFTLVALAAATLLILFAVQDYNEERYYTFLAVQNDDTPSLPMRLDITFNRMPCNLLSIEFYDELEYRELQLEKKLSLSHVKKGETQGLPYKRNIDPEVEKQLLEENVKNEVQCRVQGTLDLPKTPGTIVFKPSAFSNVFLSTNEETQKKAGMSYRINMLEFGTGNNTFDLPIAHESDNIAQYIGQLEGSSRNKQFVADYHSVDVKQDYMSHLKIIPVVINTTEAASSQLKYRYSMRTSTAVLEDDDPYEGIMFFTQIEPINIIYKKHKPSFYQLIIEVLAIVGGTVATLGLVNSMSHFFMGIK